MDAIKKLDRKKLQKRAKAIGAIIFRIPKVRVDYTGNNLENEKVEETILLINFCLNKCLVRSYAEANQWALSSGLLNTTYSVLSPILEKVPTLNYKIGYSLNLRDYMLSVFETTGCVLDINTNWSCSWSNGENYCSRLDPKIFFGLYHVWFAFKEPK